MKSFSMPAAALALVIGAALANPLPAAAVSAAATPRVTGFDVEQVTQLTPGTDLSFIVWGTPGAQAALQIDGAQRALALVETSPGIYRGIYTISQRDRIQPGARVSANLRSGNRVGSAILDEDLQTGTPRAADAVGADPKIDRFEVRHGVSGAREVQKRTQDKEAHFEVVLRMRDDDGSQRLVSYDEVPAFKVGDKVLLRDGGLTLDR